MSCHISAIYRTHSRSKHFCSRRRSNKPFLHVHVCQSVCFQPLIYTTCLHVYWQRQKGALMLAVKQKRRSGRIVLGDERSWSFLSDCKRNTTVFTSTANSFSIKHLICSPCASDGGDVSLCLCCCMWAEECVSGWGIYDLCSNALLPSWKRSELCLLTVDLLWTDLLNCHTGPS